MKVAGSVRVPGDKSISHRALILSSLADGQSEIRDILDSADVRSTGEVLRRLGASVPPISKSITVTGRGIRGLVRPRETLDCGNSGTTTRLMAGVVAGHPFSARFEGDQSLSRRPMRRIAEPLTYMGARFEFASGDGLPMTVHGADLRGGDLDTGGSSAQVKSAILLAGLVAQAEVRVTEKRQSRDHTERMLRSMGVDVEQEETRVLVRRATRLAPLDIRVPGDPSSAAFFVALATLAGDGELELPAVCLNPTRTGFFSALRRMGADIEESNVVDEGGERVGSLRVRPAALRGLRIAEDDVPALIDELPLLACVAAGAGVDLEITGAAELRVKESDRIAVVVKNLNAVGARAEELPTGLRVLPGGRKFAGKVDPEGDHRIAMAFGVLAAASGGGIEILDRECVRISYPDFWADLARVAV